jgi:hypothetical protein
VLKTQKLRDLILTAPPREGRPSHVTAASGLVKAGEFIYVISDDDFILAMFRETDDPGEVRLLLTGEMPIDIQMGKDKADLETMTHVPDFPSAPDGGLLALGSGSSRNHLAGAFWQLGPTGTIEGDPIRIDLLDLYTKLGSTLDQVNIEGGAVVGDRLRLLQRGDGLKGENAIVDLDLDRVLQGVPQGEIPASALASVTPHDIGDLEGVRLGFTDASPLGDGRLIFSAAAEDTVDPTVDGLVTGSVVGIIDEDGNLENVEPLEELFKIEGVHVVTGESGMSMFLVADADNPEVPSPLLTAILE